MPSAEPLPLPAPGPWATVRKYFNLFRVSLSERLVYRGDFLLGTVLRFFPLITWVLLWEAVYDSTDQQDQRVAGLTRHEMIAYLLLIHISRMFSSMPGLAGGITQDIRDGSLKKYLLQPLDMIGYLLSYRAAHKVAYIATSGPPYLVLFLACHNYFDHFPDAATLAAYVVALLMGFIIGFFFEACVGMVGFWMLHVSSLLWVINTLNFVVSGQMFPLDLFSPFWAGILKALPFQYLAYFPVMVFLGKIQGRELVEGLAVEVLWAAALILLTRWLYGRGLRRYSAYGG
jgi:ABC-2 type transport system permease protein